MNGVDFPVAKVLDGIAAAQEAGLGPIKVNMVVRRGINETSVVPMARWARDAGVTLRFIEFMDVGHTNGWRMDEVVGADELVAMVDAEMPLEPEPPRYRGEVATRFALPRRRRRGRGHRVGHEAVLRRLHAGPAVGRGALLHVPVHRGGPRPAGDPARPGLADRGRQRRALRDAVAAVWRVRDDRYSEERTEATSSSLPRLEMFAMGG